MKTVKTYDFQTKKISNIPSAELAPGMVQANVPGIGKVWINVRDLGVKIHQPYKWPPFDGDMRSIVGGIKEALEEVYPKTLEQWEDGFRRDTNPECEIALWLCIAEKYKKLALAASKEKQRRDYFNLIMSVVNNGKEHALETVRLEVLSKEEALRAVEFIIIAPFAE